MIPASQTIDPEIRKMRSLVEDMANSDDLIQYDPDEDMKFLKEIREKVKAIPITTPFLQQQAQETQESTPL